VKTRDRSARSGNPIPKWDGPAPLTGLLSKNPAEYKIRFTSAARKARALRKLGVSADQVAGATQITPLLKDIRGGLKAVLRAMRFSQDPVVRCFLTKHDSLGVWARENTCWEAIGLAAGIDPLRFRHLSRSGTDEKANRVRQTPRRMARSGRPRKASSRIALNFLFLSRIKDGNPSLPSRALLALDNHRSRPAATLGKVPIFIYVANSHYKKMLIGFLLIRFLVGAHPRRFTS
jgi:hypothetical protein